MSLIIATPSATCASAVDSPVPGSVIVRMRLCLRKLPCIMSITTLTLTAMMLAPQDRHVSKGPDTKLAIIEFIARRLAAILPPGVPMRRAPVLAPLRWRTWTLCKYGMKWPVPAHPRPHGCAQQQVLPGHGKWASSRSLLGLHSLQPASAVVLSAVPAYIP